MIKKVADRIGKKFGRLTVISFSHTSKHGGVYFNCICDCGNPKIALNGSLKCGDTKSCGCLYKNSGGHIKHGMVYTSTYESWSGMIKRCGNPKNNVYKHYGGRGIKICKRWLKFENFYKDMGEKPDGKSLDRINNNGNYTLKNCKWSTQKEQCNNKRGNHLITFKGKTHTIAEWRDITGISYSALFARIKRGWSNEKTIFTPMQLN